MNARRWPGLCSVTLYTASLVAQAVQLPAPSTWKLNASKSKFGNASRPRLIALTISSDSPERLAWNSILQDGGGKLSEISWEGKRDGVSRPVTGYNGVKVAYDRSGAAHWSYPDGSRADSVTEAAPDGAALSMTMHFRKGPAREEVALVYDRLKKH